MLKITAKKGKSTQYIIGAVVAIVILAFWITLPLMSGSSLDSSVSAGNPFKSKAANFSLLGSDISSETGAPGSPLSGEMIYNPATMGEDIASSLFQSGLLDETPTASPAEGTYASASVDGRPSYPAPSASADVAAPSGRSAGKLRAASSITGGNANSMTIGGKHDKFFGSGNKKADLPAAPLSDIKKPVVESDKKTALLSMLGNSAKKSELAVQTAKMDSSRGEATSAFANTNKGASLDLSGDTENTAVEGGLAMGEAAQDLKRSDPSMSQTKVTPPAKPEDATDESEEMRKEIRMMILKMVIQGILGAAFGGGGGGA